MESKLLKKQLIKKVIKSLNNTPKKWYANSFRVTHREEDCFIDCFLGIYTIYCEDISFVPNIITQFRIHRAIKKCLKFHEKEKFNNIKDVKI